MKLFVKLGLVAMILLQTSCSSLSYVDYHIPEHFRLAIQRTLPAQIGVWQTDVLQHDLHQVHEHCHWGTHGGCRPQLPNQTHNIMVDALMSALQDAFRRTPIFNESHTDPKITVRATFRQVSTTSFLAWSYAKAQIRYQFIYENKVFYETEISTRDNNLGLGVLMQGSSLRRHKALNHAVRKNLMAILTHLNQTENQSAFFSGSSGSLK